MLSRISLFFGAAVMIILGIMFKDHSECNCGLMLMWIGIAVR